jgi:Sulfatase
MFQGPMKTRSYFAVFVYIFAANIPFWVASHSIGLVLKGPFNDEFVLIGILSLFLRRTLTVGLLLAAILLDVLNSVATTYLLSPFDMLRSAGSLFEFAPSHIWDIVLVAFCIVMVCLMAAVASSCGIAGRERGYVAATLAGFIILCSGVDASTGHILALRQDRQLGTLCLTRLGTHFLVMSGLHRQGYQGLASAGTNASVPAASTMMAGFETGSPSSRTNTMLPNVVLILVESWGKPVTADLEESLVRPYADKNLTEKYAVSLGTVPFYGPTVAGEARELCGSAMGFGLLIAPRSELQGCLPTKMNTMGYHSMAVHGFSARMFDRGEWYDRIGFDEAWFRDRLKGQGLPLCPGPFPGICDAAAAGWIGDQLQRNSDSPQFVYWVTLNSHLPVPIPNLVKSPPSCSGVSITAEDPAICSWYQLVFNVHRSVSELALRSTTRPTVFLIVGDHAPPFSSSRLRSQFSDKVVPYVLLMPKRDDSQSIRPSVVATQTPAGTRRPHDKLPKTISRSPTAG